MKESKNNQVALSMTNISPVQRIEAKKVQNGLLKPSYNILQYAQWTCTPSKGDNYVFSLNSR